MAVYEDDLDNYSIYGHLTDQQVLQAAIERSLTDRHLDPHPDQTTSLALPATAESAPPILDSRLIHPYPPRPQDPVLPSQLDPPDIQSCENPPTGLAQVLFKTLKRELSPLQSIIMNRDVEVLMDLVQRKSRCLTEPNDEGWIGLHEAAYYGDLQSVRILVRAHPDSVNRTSLRNQTALLLAAAQGNTSCVDFLLKHGADPNVANRDRETPLFVACEHSNVSCVDLLLKFGAQVNRSCAHGGSPLHEACRHGNPELCRKLLQAGADLHANNVYGIQPVFTAAQHGHTEVLRLLAKKGADINRQVQDGASPLYEACKNGHVSVVDLLLTLKADSNRSTMSGLLPLHVAVQNNHSRIVSMLIPVTSLVRVRTSGISPLHIAAEKDRDDIMELLIQSGFDVNAKLSDDRSRMFEDRRSTALYFSVYNRNLEAAKMLLEAGADTNLDVFNPLFVAVRLGWTDMATLLLRYGADVNAQISTQPSTFPPAVLLRMESLHMLKLLLDHGCDAQSCFDCPYGQKPHPAIRPSHRPIEELQVRGDAPSQHSVLFCEAVSSRTFCYMAGPILSLMLDYVGHIQLCSRLLNVLESCSDWAMIRQKACPPHPLMQLCRLKIRRLLGVQRLRLLHHLPLPARLICFLRYEIHCWLT